MNGLILKEHNASRNRLLTTVSTLVLVMSISGVGSVSADEAKPSVWIELGWDFETVRNSTSDLGLPLGPLVSQSGLTAPLDDKLNFSRSYAVDGSVTFQPDGSDWKFAATVRYGRSQSASKLKQALAPLSETSFVTYKLTYPLFPSSNRTRVRQVPRSGDKLNGETSDSESHFIIDFQAGKDVGVGLFGQGSTSTLSAGVRFAHFALSRKTSNFHETQDVHFQSSHLMTTFWPAYITKRRELWNDIAASGSASQNFNGLGPSVRWEASASLWPAPTDGSISFDWGANAALLFGKQNKRMLHQTKSIDFCQGGGCPVQPTTHTSVGEVRTSRIVVVPNVGGFAGLSLDYPDVKVSLGYRADLFMNAIDVGFTTNKSSNFLLYGPFASLSIGLP